MEVDFTIETAKAKYTAFWDNEAEAVKVTFSKNENVWGEFYLRNMADTAVVQYIFSIDKGLI